MLLSMDDEGDRRPLSLHSAMLPAPGAYTVLEMERAGGGVNLAPTSVVKLERKGEGKREQESCVYIAGDES